MFSSFLSQLFCFDADESPGDRVFFRVFEVFVVVFAVRAAWTWGFYMQQIDAVASPAGLARYVDISILYDHGLSLVSAAVITIGCLVGLSRKWSPAYMVSLLLLHLQYVGRYSLGKTPHGYHFVGMSLMGLAIGFAFFRHLKQSRRFALGFTYFFIGLGYTTAAFSKLVGTGLDWPSGTHLWLWIAEKQVDMYSRFGAYEMNVLQDLILEHRTLGTVLLTFGLLTELAGFLMWWRRSRYVIIPLIICVHLGIAAAMNIFFELYVYELLLLGLPWAAWVDRSLRRFPLPRFVDAAS